MGLGKRYQAKDDKLLSFVQHTYDDKLNVNYMEIFDGDPSNDNMNNAVLSVVKGLDGKVLRTRKVMYEYNVQGYPIKSTEMNGDVKGSETVYTYSCK